MDPTDRRARRRSGARPATGIARVETAPDSAPVIGPADRPEQLRGRKLPRLARHTITLGDGHEVSLAVCGQGVPLVLVHGFTAEGILYAQVLSRLVQSGYKVIAIDVAGHGGTLGLPTSGASMEAYARLLARVLDELGVRQAVFAGHSMGGRLVCELAANEPERVLAVILLDAIVGATWDRMVNLFRVVPPLLAGVGGVLLVDTLTTVPVLRDPAQARKLGHLVAPTIAGHVRRPWRMLGPAVSILRSGGTGWMLDRIAAARIPLVVIHGDRDLAVPMNTARDAARRGRGLLVVVEKAGHSWLLRDPRTLPAIMDEVVRGPWGSDAAARVLAAGGLDAASDLAQIEAAFCAPGARIADLTPGDRSPGSLPPPGRPRYRWHVVDEWVDLAPVSMAADG